MGIKVVARHFQAREWKVIVHLCLVSLKLKFMFNCDITLLTLLVWIKKICFPTHVGASDNFYIIVRFLSNIIFIVTESRTNYPRRRGSSEDFKFWRPRQPSRNLHRSKRIPINQRPIAHAAFASLGPEIQCLFRAATLTCATPAPEL
jgi:hypothetical protein